MDKQPINYLDLEIEDDNPQWMKLVDYVNQREEETFPVPNHFITYETRFDDVHMFSKRMGFVKWLVEKDKIDLEKLSEKELATGWNLENNILDEDHTEESWFKFWTENLLMLLSIQDNPMTFMLSILK